MDRHTETPDLSRRMFLTTASIALAGTTLGGLAPWTEAAQRHPKRGGTLLFGTRTDAAGLDSHRNNQLHTSTPTAAMYTGLTDYDQKGNIIPGIAESWEPNKDLTAWVFRLRKGVLFHNGREVDAEAVKLNIERIKTRPLAAIGTGARSKTSRPPRSSTSTRCVFT
jgi:peptide/nickel transport system substrate-binding protein